MSSQIRSKTRTPDQFFPVLENDGPFERYWNPYKNNWQTDKKFHISNCMWGNVRDPNQPAGSSDRKCESFTCELNNAPVDCERILTPEQMAVIELAHDGGFLTDVCADDPNCPAGSKYTFDYDYSEERDEAMQAVQVFDFVGQIAQNYNNMGADLQSALTR